MPKICFVPIWHPVDDYVTSRLRAKYVAELLAGQDGLDVGIEYRPDADIAVMVQLCSDRNYRNICENPAQQVVYDICDRFFETHNVFRTDDGPINAGERCLELVERANALIVPTRQLKGEIARRFPDKPCFYVPELVDYGASPQPVARAGSRRLLWFGHPTRGNFESARWVIDHLRARYGYLPVLVTNPWTLDKEYPAYVGYCQPWSPAAMQRELSRAELCIVSHAVDEPSKSANRFVTAIMHGVPTLVSGSPACIEILEAAGFGELAIASPKDADRAVEWLSNPQRRAAYVTGLQKEMWRRHGPATVRGAYLRLIHNIWPGAAPSGRRLNLCFVTSLSDGLRTEPFLPDLARGLNSPPFAVHVYAIDDGPQRSRYAESGIVVDRPAADRADDAGQPTLEQAHFTTFLRDRRVDLVVCDGAMRHCRWARDGGQRTVVMLGAAPATAPDAEVVDTLGQADALVFASETSRSAWEPHVAMAKARTIVMAPSPERLARAATVSQQEARRQLGLPTDVVLGLCIDEAGGPRNFALERLVEGCSAYPLAAHFLRVQRSPDGPSVLRVHGPGLPTEGRPIDSRAGEPSDSNEALDALLFQAADFCVVPGRSSDAARDCAAAMYLGLPVVYLAPAAAEVPIQDGKQGFIAADEATAWRSFFRLSTDAKLRADMGERAVRWFWERPTYREMLKSFQSMIGELCSPPQP